jgi:predicted RNA binding protein YcfA (HicA-like mRNA interferase family)
MPKKVRELKAMLRQGGFVWRPSKGSHTKWTHPQHPGVEVTISGNDGDDARRYLEKKVRDALMRTGGQS